MKRIQIVGFTLSFVLALLLTSSVYGQMGKHNPDREFHKRDFQRGEPRGMMLEKLNLTDEQKEAVEQLRLKHQNEMIDLKADLQKKKLALKELTSKDNYSRDNYINAVKAINAAKNNIAVSMANHRMDVYDLLAPEQKKAFDDMRQDFNKRRPMFRHMMEKPEK
ncbi:periplasmic heavy metal sensor [bacterium BMS3Abin03]|nr:periplasmic heavy metal sensor [bacterium BMS3Abin03]